MRYVRFMSIEELNKYLSGEKLKNNTVWRDRGNKTDSGDSASLTIPNPQRNVWNIIPEE